LDRRPGGPTDRLNTVSKRKISSPRRKSNPYHPIIQLVASCYMDWAMPAIIIRYHN